MSISCLVTNEDELGVKLPDHLHCFPVSFQQIYTYYWKPLSVSLNLPYLHRMEFLDFGYAQWPAIKKEFLTVLDYIQKHPFRNNSEFQPNPCAEWVDEYLTQRIPFIIANIEECFGISKAIMFNI